MKKRPESQMPAVIVFDEGLPPLQDCEPGCAEDERHMCIHRFPQGTEVVAHTKKAGLKDLQVLKYVFSLARKKMGGTADKKTDETAPFVLLTNDKRFWRSARHQYRSRNGHERMHILFETRTPNIVHASIRGRVIRVDIIPLNGKRARQSASATLRWAAAQSHRFMGSLARKRPH